MKKSNEYQAGYEAGYKPGYEAAEDEMREDLDNLLRELTNKYNKDTAKLNQIIETQNLLQTPAKGDC